MISHYRNLITLLLLFGVQSLSAQLDKVFVETYYISDDNDATDTFGGGIAPSTTTYRIYLDLFPGTRLKAIYGDTEHPFNIQSTLPFFNHATDGQTFGYNFIRARYEEGTVALDTWLTLGQTARQGPITFYGIPKNQDTDGSFIGGVNNDGGSEAVTSGLLINNSSDLGIPLTDADGMDTLALSPTGWFNNGVLDFVTGNDTTIFGSLESQTSFFSTNFILSNSGVKGVDPDSNQVIIAQLTTAGELSFLLNIEVEFEQNGETISRRYTGTNIINSSTEEFNPYLSYPYTCGCNNVNYLEYDPAVICLEEGSCITPVILGCTDSLACNFNPAANVAQNSLCCYPGWCNDRNIEEVCPQLKGDSFDISIYPNPADNTLNLNVISGVETDLQYTIYNSYGQFQLEDQISTVPLNYSTTIDLQELVSGIYQITVYTSLGQQSKTFVKL